MGNQKEITGNGNGTVTVTKGKLVVGSGVIIAVLIAVTNLMPVRGNQQAQPPPPSNANIEKVEERVTELEKLGAATAERLKNIEKKLDEISAKLDK